MRSLTRTPNHKHKQYCNYCPKTETAIFLFFTKTVATNSLFHSLKIKFCSYQIKSEIYYMKIYNLDKIKITKIYKSS